MNTKVILTGLVGVTLACMAMSSCHWARAETVNFDSFQGRLFEEYRVYPPALRVNAAKLYNARYYQDSDVADVFRKKFGEDVAQFYIWEAMQSFVKGATFDLSAKTPFKATEVLKFKE